MHKYIFTLIIVLASNQLSFSQKKIPKTTELGIFLGRSYYLGELNPKTHIGNDIGSFAFGALFKYNLNRRYSLRAGLNFGGIHADDENVDLPFNQYRKASFESRLTEGHVLLEFNFMPYELGNEQYAFSPYLFVGPAFYISNPDFEQETAFPVEENEEEEQASNLNLSMPFGFGFKFNLSRRWGLSLEWGFRKGSDDLDGLPNLLGESFENGKDYDKDWYSFSGILITYKLSKKGPCPAI